MCVRFASLRASSRGLPANVRGQPRRGSARLVRLSNLDFIAVNRSSLRSHETCQSPPLAVPTVLGNQSYSCRSPGRPENGRGNGVNNSAGDALPAARIFDQFAARPRNEFVPRFLSARNTNQSIARGRTALGSAMHTQDQALPRLVQYSLQPAPANPEK